MVAWQFRNSVKTGCRGFSSISDMNVCIYDAAEVTALYEHRNWEDVRKAYGHTRFTNHISVTSVTQTATRDLSRHKETVR
jgi:hypothetical protein